MDVGGSGSLEAAGASCFRDAHTCEWSAQEVYGVQSQTIGNLYFEVHMNFYPARIINHNQYSEVITGPAINADHQYNCVDQSFPFDTSCSGGWRSLPHDEYKTTEWQWPNNWFTSLRNNDYYWMDFSYTWNAVGLPYGWGSGTFTTNEWLCRQNADCEFQP